MKIFMLYFLIFTVSTHGFAMKKNTVNPTELNSTKTTKDIAAFFQKTRSLRDDLEVENLELRLAINFNLDSDQLTSSAKAQLDSLAAVLTKPEFSQTNIELAGHTCDLGKREYNQKLSERRVRNAAHYLLDNYNLNRDRISTRAYGEDMPLIPGARDEEEREVNRRVVVYLRENRETIENMLKNRSEKSGFRWAVFKYKKDGKSDIVDYEGSSILYSNDEYRVFIRPARAKYVYIFQKDSKGHGEWIFPRKDIPYTNPLKPNEYFFPGRSKVFVLDNTVGTESIYFLVMDEPAEELGKALENNSANYFTQAMTQTIKLRGLKEVRIGPPIHGSTGNPNTIVISSPNETDPNEDGLVLKEPEGDVVNIMAQYREFFTVLTFDHR